MFILNFGFFCFLKKETIGGCCEMTLDEFEKISYVDQARYLQEAKVNIRRSENPVLNQMMIIVEEEVITNKQDFYVRDVAMLSVPALFLWVLSDKGTLLLDLEKDDFVSDEWINKTLYYNFANQHRISTYYLINTKEQNVKHISTQSAFATLCIYEDMARSSYELKKKFKWLTAS